jgi:hypothetical protein
MGDEVLLLEKGWDKINCPLAVIRAGITMKKFPPPGMKPGERKKQEEDLKPRMTNMSSGGRPEDWVLLVEAEDQFAVNIGKKYYAGAECGDRQYFRTNHFHIVAAKVGSTVQKIEYSSFDPQLVYESDSLGRMDLLAFHVQKALLGVGKGLRRRRCLTDARGWAIGTGHSACSPAEH